MSAVETLLLKAHKSVARVAGQVSLAIETKRLGGRDVTGFLADLEAASSALRTLLRTVEKERVGGDDVNHKFVDGHPQIVAGRRSRAAPHAGKNRG